MIAIDRSKQKALNTNPKTMLKISFTANPVQEGSTTMLFFIEDAKETILYFSKRAVKVLCLKKPLFLPTQHYT